MTWVNRRGERSVPSEAAWRNDCLKFAEVEFANRSQRLGGRAVLKAVRQAIQPGRIFYLGFHETGDVVIPALRSAAVIGRTTNVDYRCAGCARDAAFPLRSVTSRLNREADQAGPVKTDQLRFLKRQLSLPVSMMSQ
jgi:hypothetical protein